MNFFVTQALFIVIFGGLCAVQAHSWVDQIQVSGTTTNSAPDGKLGYIRNYAGHVDTETSKILDPTLNAPVCMNAETAQTQAANMPRLTASPGDMIMASYTENGHVSLPPANSIIGNIYWYGTAEYDPATTLAEVRQWNAAGTGGNGKGQLLGTTPFDDGACAEDNQGTIALARKAAGGGGACHSSFQLPTSVKAGTYSVFWVWDYSGKNGPPGPGHAEWYTSCMDINVAQGAASSTNVTQPSTESNMTGNATIVQGRPSYGSARFRMGKPRV